MDVTTSKRILFVAALAFPLVLGLASAALATPLFDGSPAGASDREVETACASDPRVVDHDPRLCGRGTSDLALGGSAGGGVAGSVDTSTGTPLGWTIGAGALTGALVAFGGVLRVRRRPGPVL